MNQREVIALLEANKDQQGIEKWERSGKAAGRLKSLGIGLTRLRKLAKQVGRDHALAEKLWKSGVYDARIIAILIDDPEQMTPEQADSWVERLRQGHLAHVFAACGAPLAETAFAVELATRWMGSDDAMRRHCGYTLVYEVSKWKKKSAPDDAFFLERVDHIERSFHDEERFVQGAMGGALMGIGKRNATLNAAALKVARAIGPIQLGGADSGCAPFDVVKHLTSDYITKKLGL